MSSFKDQYVASLEHNEGFVANLIAEYHGSGDWTDYHDLAIILVGHIRSWEFDSIDSFQAHLEEFEIINDRLKTAVMNAQIEGIEFFAKEIFVED